MSQQKKSFELFETLCLVTSLVFQVYPIVLVTRMFYMNLEIWQSIDLRRQKTCIHWETSNMCAYDKQQKTNHNKIQNEKQKRNKLR